jgi:hypothetical protein
LTEVPRSKNVKERAVITEADQTSLRRGCQIVGSKCLIPFGALRNAVARGLSLVTDAPSPLAQAFCVRFQPARAVATAESVLFSTAAIDWHDAPPVVFSSLFDGLTDGGYARLVKKYGATFQIEDPFMDWSKPPERYVELGETYKKILGTDDFVIDINIVPIHTSDQISFPTEQATGAELLQLYEAAVSQVRRVAFYAESQFSDADWLLLKRLSH